jgi:peptide deformylase
MAKVVEKGATVSSAGTVIRHEIDPLNTVLFQAMRVGFA